MGDRNQLLFLQNKVPAMLGAVLEVGSKDHGSTQNLRALYHAASRYVGLDMEAGAGVDAVLDLGEHLPDASVRALGTFDLVVCCSVLEHVRWPWVMAGNITRLTRHGARLYISVPWVWRYHGYPDDYWRFSPSAVSALFPSFQFEEPAFSTTKEGEFFRAVAGADDRLAGHHGQRKYLPYLMLHMLGTKK